MARKRQKKGEKGNAKNYITRTKALRRLQLSLKDFRQICIFKGIYPREPRKKVEGQSKTYYLMKDIQFLQHESVIDKMRELKVFRRKLKRAQRKGMERSAQNLQAAKPRYTLDHIVRERFPTFIDCVNDMDDALCLVHLFANFPATKTVDIKIVASCGRMAREFQHYVMKARMLRKVFVSVKGIYYQAEIMGAPVTWVVPHAFSQQVPTDVDYRVMVTFLEFSCTQLKFVNFKLYHDMGLAYPPKLNEQTHEGGLGLAAVRLLKAAAPNQVPAAPQTQGGGGGAAGEQDEADVDVAPLSSAITAKIAGVDQGGGDEAATSAAEATDAGADGGVDDDDDDDGGELAAMAEGAAGLFCRATVFLSREVNVEALLFVLRACGASAGAVGWDGPGSPIQRSDDAITHEIVDRPSQQKRLLSREYVQPQWVFDSVNAEVLLPCPEYAVGAALPPHLSPFVDNEKHGYTPRRARELAAYKEGKRLDEIEWSDDEMLPEDEEEEEEDVDQDEDQAVLEQDVGEVDEDDVDGGSEEDEEDEEDEEEEDEEEEEHDEEEEEEHGVGQKRKAEVEEQELAGMKTMMMTKKNYRLYQRMQHGIGKKQDVVDTLKRKRRKIEKNTSAAK